MTTPSVPLTTIKHALSMVDNWFDSHRQATSPLDRLALEETWNSYYSLAEVCKSPSQPLVSSHLSTLYLETVRLQQLLLGIGRHHELTTVTTSVDHLLSELKQRLEPTKVHQILEAAEQIVTGHATDQMTNHSIPSSPTPRPQKATPIKETMISGEQLERLLSGYASNGFTKEQLAHELMMDPDFQLQKSKPASELEQRIDTIARQVFFDRVNQDIQQGGQSLIDSVLPLLDDIKTRLLSFIPTTATLHQTINDVMDLSLFEQQMNQGGFDLTKVIQFCLDMMLQMAAPIRDNMIRQIGTTTDNDDNNNNQGYQLRSILETLELMSLDLMNFRLKSLRPHLVPVAVEYEHDGFAKAVAQGTVGLAKTRQWLQQSQERLVSKSTEQKTESSSSSSSSSFSTKLLVEEGYIGLFTATTAWTRLTCPETVLLDIDRIVTYQNELQKVTIVAALAMLGRNAGIKDIKSFTKRMFLLLNDTHETKGITLEHLSLEMERALLTGNNDASDEKKQWIRSMVGKTLSNDDPLYRLLAQRTLSVIRHQLATGKFVDDSALLQSGLEPVRPQLHGLCTRVKMFAEHNYRVYASWYHDLVNDL